MRMNTKRKISRLISLLTLFSVLVWMLPVSTVYACTENEIRISPFDKIECLESTHSSVVNTTDGGLALIGNSKHSGKWLSYIHFIKTDENGILQWERLLDLGDEGFAHQEKEAFSLKETEDGYVMAGAINIENQSDALIVKTDLQGSVQWVKRFGLPNCEWLYDVEIVSDGILAAGNKQHGNKYYTYIVKLSCDGALLWEYTGDYPGGRLKDLTVLEDGSLAAIGYKQGCAPLVRLTEDGYEIYGEADTCKPGCLLDYMPASINKDAIYNISVDIPEFKRTVDTEGSVLYEIPYIKAFTKKSYTPLLPMVTRIYILPKGSVINKVELADQVTELREEPTGLKMLIPEADTCGPLGGSFTLDNLYPQDIFNWKQYNYDDGVYLYLNIIPVQYNYEEGQMTLYKSLNFNVNLSIPEAPVNIIDVIVNSGDPAIDRMCNVTANAQIFSESSRTVNMGWIFRDISGRVIAAGNKEAGLIPGENAVSFTFDSTAWTSGNKELTVTLKDATKNSPILASYFTSVEVTGFNICIEAERRIFNREDTVALKAEVRDERGFPVTGLSEGAFGIMAGDSSIYGFNVTESLEGLYDISFPASLLEEKVYRLNITCTEGVKYGKSGIKIEVKASE